MKDAEQFQTSKLLNGGNPHREITQYCAQCVVEAVEIVVEPNGAENRSFEDKRRERNKGDKLHGAIAPPRRHFVKNG
jgi:hypothetical protein